jgi:hypothetical protein
MEDPQTGFQLVHTAWTAVITVAGGIVAFFTKRLVDQVDAKADKCDVEELKQDIKDFISQQAQQHAGNTDRLDRIIMELGRKDR